MFTIGCDPEFFLVKGGNFVSSIGIVGGSKHEPKPIGDGCAVQEDNVAVEFCIPPAKTMEEFRNSIQYSLDTIIKSVPKGLSISREASALFSTSQLRNPKAKEFGCDPDFNVWTRTENPRPTAKNKRLRSAGGHVHIGCLDVDMEELIKACDLFLGVPATKLDKDVQRRELYGKAGCFRPKPYGVEYRTLSNFWIFDKNLIDWVYHQTSRAINWVKDRNTLSDEDGVIIQACINHNDNNAYDALLHKYKGAFQ